MDWRVKAVKAGEATIRMKALTDEESDAMEMKFPVYVHGMLKTESFSGVIRPEKESALVAIRVPAERRPEQTRLEVRWSPTLAGAMVDALPYLADYPYGCTEQTLDRFLPTVVTQKVLLQMGLNLKEIQQKRTNLNAQEIGDDADARRRLVLLRRLHEPRHRPRQGAGLRPSRAPRHGQGRHQPPGQHAVLRRRLGLVQRLGRAILAAHHRVRRPRACRSPAPATWRCCPT